MGIMGMFGGGGGGGFRPGGGMGFRPQSMGAIGGMMPAGIPNPYFQPIQPPPPPPPMQLRPQVPGPQAGTQRPPAPAPGAPAQQAPQQQLPPNRIPLTPSPAAPLGAAKPPMVGATPPGPAQQPLPPSPLGPTGPQQIPVRPAPQGGMPPGLALNPAQPPTGATSPHLAFNPGAPNSFNPANAPSAFSQQGPIGSPLTPPPPLPDRNPMRTGAPPVSMVQANPFGPPVPQYGPPTIRPQPPMTRPLPNPNRIVGEMPTRKPAPPQQLPAMAAINDPSIAGVTLAQLKGLHPDLQSKFVALNKANVAAGFPPLQISSGHRSPSQNARAGGAKGSYHKRGMAFDLAGAANMSRAQKDFIVREASKLGFGGLGDYRSGALHFDIGPRRSWGATGYSGDPMTYRWWDSGRIP